MSVNIKAYIYNRCVRMCGCAGAGKCRSTRNHNIAVRYGEMANPKFPQVVFRNPFHLPLNSKHKRVM